MRSRLTKIGIRTYNRRLRAYDRRARELTGSLQTALTEARLVRRTLEMVGEMRRAVAAELTRPHGPIHHLDLRHANRVF
jgi:hypothetical protein